MKTILNKIKELEESIEPVLLQIETLRKEYESLRKEKEQQILLENQETVNLFNDNEAEYIFVDIEADVNRNEVGEDDGTLHIAIGQVRGCFICNQDISRKEWNKQARIILDRMNIKTTIA